MKESATNYRSESSKRTVSGQVFHYEITTSNQLHNPANAFYATSIVLEASEFAGGRKFLDAYQAAFKIPPACGGHHTYDATYILAAAIRRANSSDPTKVSEVLRKMDGFAPVTGSMKWDDKGEQRYGVVSVYKVNGGRWKSIIRSDNWQ